MMIGWMKAMKRKVTSRRIVEDGVERGYGRGMQEVPGKGECGGGIVEGCIDCNCQESCEQGREGEHNEGEGSKSTVVISGV